jgi:signal transduction histidine kinase/integral membrane sensor domain MASE1/CheY-like chemotaxis protein
MFARDGLVVGGARVPTGLLVPVVAALYFGFARLGLSLAFVAPQVSVVWPPSGIALVAVLLFGRRAAPALSVGAFAANLAVDEPILTAAGIAVGNTLEALVGAELLRRAGFLPSLERVRDVLALLVFGALTSTVLSATIGSASLCVGGVQPCEEVPRILLIWWLGDAMGVLVVAPLLLTWMGLRRARMPAPDLLRLLAFLAGVTVLCWLLFNGPVGQLFTDLPFHYALVPVMVGAALWFGQLGTTAVTALASTIAIAGTLTGVWHLSPGNPGHSLVLLQLFLATVAVSGLLLAAAMSERAAETRRREADYTVTRVLADAPSLTAAAPPILRAVCESLRWEFGALWVSDGAGLLRCLETWHVPSRSFAAFETATRRQAFAAGAGLPGRVWATGEPAWIPDAVVDRNFPRSPQAAQDGLHAGFAFPIRVGPDVHAVMEFFSVELHRPDERLLARMAALGSQIGQFLERQRAEEERQRAEAARRRAEDERAQVLAREREARIQAQALARIGGDLVTSLEPHVVEERIVESVCELLEGWVAVLYAIDADSGDLLAVARAGRMASRLVDDYRLARDAGLVGLAVRERRPVVSANVLADTRVRYSPEERAQIERAGHRSACALPLLVKGNVIGALGIGGPVGRVFDDRAIALAATFADLAALALDNARSFLREQTAREQAETANRSKDEFLAMLSHELRNPLGAVTSAVSVLNLMDLAPDARVAQLHEIITRQVRHLTRLVDDLLDVARLASGRLELQRADVDLGKLVEQCVASLAARTRGHRLEVAVGRAVVHGDAARLEQIVTNLLDNAVKYTPPGGSVRVLLTEENRRAVLRVRDSGIGIAPDLLPRIFDLFTQDARSLDRARGGLGLGLAVVSRLVAMHGGRVWAESDGSGQGSEFVVELPLAEAPREAVGAPAVTSSPRAQRLLIVEDHDDAREGLRLLLAAGGHTVKVASDGPAGLELLRAWRPDIALVDIGLPELDGYAFARAVRADSSIAGTLLVALTGYGQPEDRRQAFAAGFDAHVVKPVSPEGLARTLASLAAARGDRPGHGGS